MKKSKNDDDDNPEIFGRPQGVWESEFLIGRVSLLRGGRKGDPDTKSGLGTKSDLGKFVLARAIS